VRFLTKAARLTCGHAGRVILGHRQSFVSVGGEAVLVAPDPEGRAIVACPNAGATIKPCLRTLPVTAGYSGFVTIEGDAVCLDTVVGLTDGTPPGVVEYRVDAPGQGFVESDA
jgi:hypothetical protein